MYLEWEHATVYGGELTKLRLLRLYGFQFFTFFLFCDDKCVQFLVIVMDKRIIPLLGLMESRSGIMCQWGNAINVSDRNTMKIEAVLSDCFLC